MSCSSRPNIADRLEALVDPEAPPMQGHVARLMPVSSPSPQPVLRWLGAWSPYKPASPQPSPPSSSPPSPGLALLNEALTEPLAFPPTAHLPDSFSTSRALARAPPFLDNLTRSTLPTASLSPPASTSAPPDGNPFRAATSVHSPPEGSSVATLRSVSLRDHKRARSLHSVASPIEPSAQPESSIARWWFQSENKDAVDALLNEDDRADSVQQEQHILHRKYRSPKNPVVFCHGLLGFDSVTIGPSIAPMQVTHWRGIKEVLEANGTEVLITRVPATSSPIDRAKVLEEKISEVYPGRSVHLIGHSMGGLDCRYLTTHLKKRKFQVLSLTTIATPHRGSAFADHFLSTVGRTRMPSVLSLLDLLPNGGGDGKAFECLTIESMRKFNEETPDVPGVQYFSWGATYEPGLIDTWKWPHSVVFESEGENDGLVSVASSKWGKYLGTISGVSHLNLVGWINTAQYKWAEMMGREITFRPATFYLGIADMLAGDVEGRPAADKQPETGSSGFEPRPDHTSLAVGGNKAGCGVDVAEDSRPVGEPAGSAGSQPKPHRTSGGQAAASRQQ
ncbi:Alpha/Beta hydrolase protein [Mycena belliarum]|uniref:GPI inositol-deacylase n=1 Tax=Mycena belliarum TaxID=1033014 RepID=A0AAD6UGL6_9AGAR|nr:Alpha/Beta hydrolase protein [Mycena belliae]